MKRSYFLEVIVSLVFLLLPFNGMKAKTLHKISENEQKAMLNEADDWIDDMPEGTQDRISDAILHSIRGFNSEILNYRGENKKFSNSSKVTIKDLKGGKSGELRMRLYEPTVSSNSSYPLPLLVYFHGGLWSYGSFESSEEFCKELASTGIIKIITVDYPLAPENPYPAALDKCMEAIEDIYGNAKRFGSAKEMISVGGDDAGGNLAVAAVAKILENNSSNVKFKSLILYYPILNAKVDKTVASWRKYGRGYGLDSRLLDAGGTAYLGGMINNGEISNAEDPFVSPIYLNKEQLSNMPPVLLIAAGRDMLIDSETEFISNLKSAGNKTVFIEFNGAIHGFIDDGHQPTALRKAVELTADFLQE